MICQTIFLSNTLETISTTIYIARIHLLNQEPVISQITKQQPAIIQSPSEYSHRTPSTYQNPVSTQNPFIRQGQEPNIKERQNPFIRQADNY